MVLVNSISYNLSINEEQFGDNSPIKQTFSFKHSIETKNLDCQAFFAENNSVLENYTKQRVKIEEDPTWRSLPMNCKAIRERHYFQEDLLYEEEATFPIAYARAVYTDYRFLEMELAASYAPQNHYCYAIDKKASWKFKKRMNALAKCFPNVYLTKKKYPMDRYGLNMGYSHLECMKTLFRFDWKYLILLQNHDVPLKTNQELIQIFEWYNGTNDVGALKAPPLDSLNEDKSWNQQNHQKKIRLNFAKSFVQTSLSRKAVNFILQRMNLTGIIDKIHENSSMIDGVGMTKDELLTGTLNAEDRLNLPGGFTQHCLKQGIETDCLTRLTYWNGKRQCRSKIYRHYMCIFGMEHMIELQSVPHLFANKFMPGEDFGAIACWFEFLQNQTHLSRNLNRLDKVAYWELPQVRYNRERSSLGPDLFDINKFKCKQQ
ncbi:hypothetical protein M3Y97_01138000 [Aphelenchoides bicaudatus]|nr:hypothetical protein M3Y97_01138000 [Aphelenchoides bicaudatus]